MIKKIMEKIMRKNKTENSITWPCDWDYEAVEMFNIMLSGMEKQP